MDDSKKAYLDYAKVIDEEKIPHYDVQLGDEELRQVSEVVKSNWLSEGKKTREFEDKFRELVGTKYAYATANCTGGLMMALRAVGVNRDDEVIVPTFTHMGSVSCIGLVGGIPSFADIDSKSFTVDPKSIEKAITSKTKAIIAVHLYGHPADMDRIMEISKKHDIPVIEDCAPAVGSKYHGTHVGNFGSAGGFSFFADKTITTGEGGMLVTNDPKIGKEILMLKNDGRIERGEYVSDRMGYNFRITDLQSAIALPQMDNVNEAVERKRKIVRIYEKYLKGTNGIEFPEWDDQCFVNPHRANIIVDEPENLMNFLQKNNMGARRFFYPVHRYPIYKTEQNFPNSEYAYEHGLSLPSSPLLDENTIQKVCEKVKEFTN